MGTSGFLGYVRKDGTRKGCYNRLDGNPTALGRGIVDFLSTLKPEDFDLVAERIEQIQWVQENEVPDDEVKAEYIRNGFNQEPTYESYFDTPEPKETAEETAAKVKDWFDLLRAFVTHIWPTLPQIENGTLRHLIDGSRTMGFCEWIYFLDFHKRTLEVDGRGHEISLSFDKLLTEPACLYSLGREEVDWIEDECSGDDESVGST